MYKRLLVTVLLLAAPTFGYVPDGGWDYLFDGNQAIYGPANDNDSLDGSWDHNNSSDEWDGSGIGEGAPGGISALTDPDDTTFLRIQDTGHPGSYGIPSPTNRKIYVTRVIPEGDGAVSVLDSGEFVFGFRARISTGDPLDDVHPSDGSGITPWPVEGNGYVGHDRGKGNFVMGNADAYREGEQIAFSIAYLDLDKGILNMNRANGPVVGTGDLEPDPYDNDEGVFNGMTFDNPTSWHEFLVTCEPDLSGVGTHVVTVVIDPDDEGVGLTGEFIVTAGIDASARSTAFPVNFIGLDLGSTGQWGAIDVDWIAYQVPEPATIALLGLGGLALLRRRK